MPRQLPSRCDAVMQNAPCGTRRDETQIETLPALADPEGLGPRLPFFPFWSAVLVLSLQRRAVTCEFQDLLAPCASGLHPPAGPVPGPPLDLPLDYTGPTVRLAFGPTFGFILVPPDSPLDPL